MKQSFLTKNKSFIKILVSLFITKLLVMQKVINYKKFIVLHAFNLLQWFYRKALSLNLKGTRYEILRIGWY